MSPLAEQLSFRLYADGAMTAQKLHKVVGQPIEQVYGALVELENRDRVRVEVSGHRRVRVWASNDRRAA